MSRRKKQQDPQDEVVVEVELDAEAVPDEVLAEGSGGTEIEAAACAEPDDGVDPITSANGVEPGLDLAEPALDLAEPALDLAEPALDLAEPALDLAGEVGEVVAAVDVDADPDADPEAVGDVAAVLPTSAATFDDTALKHLVEAIVFASDKPVTMLRLRQLTRIADVTRLERVLELLAVDFTDRGIALQQVSGGYQFRTNTIYSAWVQQLIAGRPVRLSRAQLETLAIVAYRQPITRPEIDEIRGVDSSATLRLLLDRSLIRVLGKREEVGRPMLYGTTGEFLDFFSLHDLRELPTLREYSELTAESRQVMSDRLGVAVEPEISPSPAAESAPDLREAFETATSTASDPGHESESELVAESELE